MILSQSLEADFIERLQAFVRIASVSTEPGQEHCMREACDWLAEWARSQGFHHEIWETPGKPCVYIETPPVPGQPVLLIYGHYDVQPAEIAELWTHPPFEPKIIDDKLYGRGASDNKGQIWLHCCALEAIIKSGQALPLQVKLLIEGEEEIGSPSLPALLEQKRQRLRADLVLVSDTSTVIKGSPTIHYSLRGIVIFEVELKTAERDVHSGVFGGTSPNAIHQLAKLIASIHDQDGKVVIPGFYDRVRPIQSWEKSMLEAIPFDPEVYRKFIGCQKLCGEAGYDTNERRWFRPTLDCNGITGGFQGEGSKTIVPARASAKFSARLVADQRPQEVLEACRQWFEAQGPLEFRAGSGGPPYFLNPQGDLAPYIEKAKEALFHGFGVQPLLVRHGGAIPIVSQFESILGLSTLLMGFGSPDDAIHSPNEKFELSNFRAGLRSSIHFLFACAQK